MNAPTTTARLLTAPARGGIAVIALAGPGAREILREVFRPRGSGPGGDVLSLGWIVDGDERLDEAIVALGPAGVDWAEINIHGGPHVARKVLTLLAERGAEIIADDAADPALAAPRARLSNPAVAGEMLSALRSARTPLAAAAVTAQWSGGLSSLAASENPDPAGLRAAADALPLMKRLLSPAEVVIAGPPNVGKSALANALLGRNVSIVSDTPGTTRDWVRTLADADGVPIWLTDTAGLSVDADPTDQARKPQRDDSTDLAVHRDLEAEAVRRAWGRIESADLIVCVTAGPTEPRHRGLLDRLRDQRQVLNVTGKCDVLAPGGVTELAVSAKTLTGIDTLRRAIRERLGFGRFDAAAAMAFTDRQARLLNAAAGALDRGDADAARSAVRELLAGR